MHGYDRNTTTCIEECLRCYQSCFGMAMTYCLETGSKHVEPKHFRLMTACAEICRTAVVRTPRPTRWDDLRMRSLTKSGMEALNPQ